MKRVSYFEITYGVKIGDAREKRSEKIDHKLWAIGRYCDIIRNTAEQVDTLRIWAYMPKGEKIDYTWELNKFLYNGKIKGIHP